MQIISNNENEVIIKGKHGPIALRKIKKTENVDINTLDNHMSNATQMLCIEKPFFGYLLMGLVKEYDGAKVPTMGVYINGVNNYLIINPEFFMNLTGIQKQGLLEHELNHIAFFHTTVSPKGYDKDIQNIAMDIVVNQYIERSHLPSYGCFYEDYVKQYPNMKKDQGWEYYYHILKDDYDSNNPCKNMQMLKDAKEAMGSSELMSDSFGSIECEGMSIDLNAHNGFGSNQESNKKLTPTEIDIIENQCTHVMNNITNNLMNSGCGKVPGHIFEILERLNKKEPPRFNYCKFIRRFAGNSQKNNVRNTRSRPNLLYPENPGLVTDMFQNVLIAVDTSGSMSSELERELCNEYDYMLRKGYDVTMMQFDTQITSVKPWKKKGKLELTGRGGTDFNEIIKYYNENYKKYSCMIVFSDGECNPPTVDAIPKDRILWCFTTKYSTSHKKKYPGTVIEIEGVR